MKKFIDWKIKYKFISLLVLCLIIIGTSVLIEYKSIKEINKNLNNMNNYNLSSINILNNINKNILTCKELCDQLINKNENINKTLLIENIATIKEQNEKLMQDYKQKKYNIDDMELYDSLTLDSYTFKFYEDAVINEVNAGKYDEANKDYSNLRSTADTLNSEINQIIELNVQHTKDENLKNANIYRKTNFAINIFILIETIGVALFDVYIIKYITSNINKNLKFALEIAIGKYDDVIDVNSKDEFGTLGKALNKASLNTKCLMEDLKKSKEKLKESEERYRLAVEGTNDGIWDVDLVKNVIYLSNHCKDILGIDMETNIIDINKWNEMFNNYELFDINISETYKEFIIKSNQNNEKIIISKGKAICDENGNKYRIVGSVSDVTDERKADKLAKYIAYNDKLTELPNRVSFNENMERILKDIYGTNEGILFLLNIDNFKNINEVYGHEIGDVIINNVSLKLKSIINYKDNIYYMGGDSFSIFSTRLKTKEEIEEYAEKIIATFKKPFKVENCIIYISSSIGISIYPYDGENTGNLLKNADMALNHAKTDGKNTYKFYDETMQNEALNKMVLQNDLKGAVENKQFMLYYQPKYDIKTGVLDGMEALIRWYHPKKGVIMPGQFIDAAEETGLIIDIGEFVLREACSQNKMWQDLGYKPLRIAVNVSVEQLEKDNFIDTLKDVLNDTKLDPMWLELEVTESGIIKNFDTSIDKLYKIRELGICVTLDDFGTGYSSLNYLISLPINTIKIDKSFIDNIVKDEKDKFVANSLIRMVHGIGLNVVAEGVETVEQLNILKDYECNIVQGYYFSKPVCSKDFENLMIENEKRLI